MGIAIGIAICYIISIHASREGSDVVPVEYKRGKDKFQSTLPVGEATFPMRFM